MPSIQSVNIGPSTLTITTSRGQKVFDYSNIDTSKTPAQIEAVVNTWCASNIVDTQVVCHVFSSHPLSFTIGTFNLGATIPANWWN